MIEKRNLSTMYGWQEERVDNEDDLDDFLREIYQDTGYDDQDLEGMLEEWEANDAEDNN